MAVGKEIKVVLTLDDNGFSSKGTKARETVKALDLSLKDILKSASGFEGGVAAMTKEVGNIAPAVQGVERILQSIQKELANTVDKLAGIGKQARSSKGGLDDLNGSLTPLQRTLAMVGKDATDTGVSIAQMKPSLAAAATGFRELTKAQQENVAANERGIKASMEARAAQLKADISADQDTIASKLRMYEQLRAAEQSFLTKQAELQAAANKARAQKKASSSYQGEADRAGSSAAVIRAEMDAIDALLPKLKATEQARRSEIGAIEGKKKALADIEAYVGAANAREVERIKNGMAVFERNEQAKTETLKKELAERTAAEKAAAEEAATAQKRAVQEAAAETRRQNEAMASMMKGMAQMWAAAKIEHGLGASVNAADKMQRERMMVSALNLPKDQEDAFFASSSQMAKNLQFISQLDAIQARMSAIASLGKNDAELIDATLSNAVKATNNLQYLGLAHGDTQSMIRNLYGVTEMRQQTGDSAAMNSTFDILQKITTGTAGKVQVNDMETVLRRFGAGASQLTDTGLVHLAALVDQFKVSGGDVGGSGGGVSTVGTIMKMFQAYAMGKGLSNQAVGELYESGVLKGDAVDPRNGGMTRDIAKSLKNAGFKNADQWLQDPVAAMQGIFPALVEYTKKHQKEFYEGRDATDPTNQMNAVIQVLQRMGITQGAIQGFTVAADPRSAKRISDQTATIENSKGIDQVNKQLGEQFGQNMTKLKAELTDVAMIVGNTLLPPLNELLKIVIDIVGSFRDFAENNPALTSFLAISAAAGSAALGVSGLMSLFGVNGITGMVEMLGTVAAKAFPTFTGLLAKLGGMVEALMPGFGSFLGFLTKFAGWIAGAGFAFVMGYAIGTWIKDIQVGGMSVQNHITNMMLGVEIGIRTAIASMMEKWHAFKAALGMGGASDAAEDAERRAEIKSLQDMKYQPKAGMTDEEAAQYANADHNKFRVATPETVKATSQIANAYAGRGALPQNQRHQRADLLTKALGEAQARIGAAELKLQALDQQQEALSDLYAQAAAEVEGKRQGGDYDDRNNNRPGANDPRIQRLIEMTYQQKLLGEETKALTFANERLTAATQNADTAMERISDGTGAKESAAMRALSNELARAEQRLGAGAQAFDKWREKKNLALFEQSRADMANFAAGMVDSNAADASKYLPTEQLRVLAELDAAEKKERDQYALLANELQLHTAATIQSYEDQLAAFQGTETQRDAFAAEIQQKIDNVQQQARDTQLAAEEQQTEALKNQALKRQHALEQPIEALAREWKDTYKNLEGYQDSWANGFINMLTQGLGTGRLKIQDFLKGIVLDIANAKLKETLADPLKQIITAGTDVLTNTLFKGAKGPVNEAAGQTTDATVLDFMSRHAKDAGDALKNMTESGVDQATQGLAQSAVQATKDTAVSSVFSSALTEASAALQEFILALHSGAGGAGGAGGLLGSLFSSGASDAGFGTGAAFGSQDIGLFLADGGIVDSAGMVPLRKYARGGIANSPQLAMYGEAGPEAYVPLPDGRSIPVTMSGGGAAPAVTVNVINQSGQNVDAKQGGVKFDGKQYVLDVVLSAANQPGSFRDGLKNAVKT